MSEHKPVSPITVNSFFAGIGGFDYAFERAGFLTSLQCEINDYCLDVLSTHWPSTPKHDDINSITRYAIPPATVWCGGFPCQDVSVARASGRLGLNGARSGLFYRYAELIAEDLPKVVLMENVLGLLNANGGRDFRVIIDTFLKMGYALSWRVLNSRYFGVPQSRPRVFMCAWLAEPGLSANVLFEREHAPRHSSLGNPRSGFLESSTHHADGPIVPKVAYCLAATSGRHTGTDWSRTYVSYRNQVRRMTPKEYEALQGFPPGWTVPTATGFGDVDQVDTLRYTALGNAVSVPVVEWIARRVMGALLSAEGADSQVHAESWADDVTRVAAPDFGLKQNKPKKIDLPDITDADPISDMQFVWPSAGIAWAGSCISATVAPAPSQPRFVELSTCIEPGHVDSRYYLSPNAAEGVLRRVKSQKRRLFGPLDRALVALAAKKTTDRDEVADTD